MANRMRISVVCGFLAAPALGQCLEQRLQSPSPIDYGRFGAVVQMNEHGLFVADWTGVMRVYGRNGAGRWVEHQAIRPADGSVISAACLDSDRLIVGDPFSDLGGIETGGAYIFDFDGEQWRETGQIAPVEPGWRHEFASAVAIRGNVAIVGQGIRDLAWVYEETPSGWEFREKLEAPDDPPVNSSFGGRLAMDGGWLFVSAAFDRSVAPNGGAVYVYQRGPGAELTFTQKLVAPDVAAGPRFGISLALAGNVLAVGGNISYRLTEGQGAVYIHELRGDRWQLTQELTHDDPVGIDRFGNTLDLAGSMLAIGAPTQPTPVGYGAAYLFVGDSAGSWRQRAKLMPDRWSYEFGGRLATDGRSIGVGAWGEPVGAFVQAGAAYVFELGCILCRVDLDVDGALTLFDFLRFFNLFAAGDLAADFDGDGALTLFDFLLFQDEFAARC
ncbi:MAG: GC-type dockerin domain-anchored protein [Phycisphaerales bacterium JB039]